MAKQIRVGEMAQVSIGDFKDALGNPTTVESVIAVIVSDPTKCEILMVDDEPFVAPLMSGNPVGTGLTVNVECDVRFGEEVKSVVFTSEPFDVPPMEAVTGVVTIGDPVARP